jgi:hypothetical protein
MFRTACACVSGRHIPCTWRDAQRGVQGNGAQRGKGWACAMLRLRDQCDMFTSLISISWLHCTEDNVAALGRSWALLRF